MDAKRKQNQRVPVMFRRKYKINKFTVVKQQSKNVAKTFDINYYAINSTP